MQQSTQRYGDTDPVEPVRVADDSTDCTVRRRAVRQLASRLSPCQRVPLLPRSRVALLERYRGSQHVPHARQSLRRRASVAFRPQSCLRRLGSVIIAGHGTFCSLTYNWSFKMKTRLAGLSDSCGVVRKDPFRFLAWCRKKRLNQVLYIFLLV